MLILTYKIAKKFLFTLQKKEMRFSIIFISILSITLSTLIISISLGIVHGFHNEINHRIVSIIPHIRIENINIHGKNLNDLIDKFSSNTDIVNVFPYINIWGLLQYKDKIYKTNIQGINLNEKMISLLNLKKESIFLKYSRNKIIIGKELARNLNISPGHCLSLILSKNKNKSFTYDIFKLNLYDIFSINSYLDNNISIIPISDMQNYTNNNKINGIAIQLKDAFDKKKIIKLSQIILNENINKNFRIYFWFNDYENIYKDLELTKIIIYFSIILISLISCISIINSLITIFRQRESEIITLLIIGMERKYIFLIFSFCSMIITFMGVCIGLILLTIITYNIKYLNLILDNILNIKLLLQNNYFINEITINIDTYDILKLMIFILLVNSISVIYTYQSNIKNKLINIFKK